MTSNMPYTLEDAKAAVAGTGDNVWWPRPNTKVIVRSNREASIYLYGGHIAWLHDRNVQMSADPEMSNTTRNRLNDILIPLGFKLSVDAADKRTYVVPRSLDVARREYETGMVVERPSAHTKGN